MVGSRILNVETPFDQEGVSMLMDVIVAECFLAKNIMVTVAGQTPYRALYGRDPPALAEFEPTSETQPDFGRGAI